MIEVLVTIVILAFGLLGLAGLEGKMQLAEVEQALGADANRATADTYVSGSVFGTGLTDASPCPAAAGPPRDQCEWSVALKGAAEKKSSTNIGAMANARGCIERIQAPDPTPTVCTPGIYLVTIIWQGLSISATPSAACASTVFADDRYRRAISARVVIGMPECV